MKLFKKFCKANSILETVVALALLSITLGVFVTVITSVAFKANTKEKQRQQNQVMESFFWSELDSITPNMTMYWEEDIKVTKIFDSVQKKEIIYYGSASK